MKFLIALAAVLAVTQAISFIDLIGEEWTTFKVIFFVYTHIRIHKSIFIYII